MKISLLCLFFIGLPGAHQVMAKSFVSLQSNTYIAFPLLLALYHLLFFAKNNTKSKYDKSHLGLVALSLAVSFTFTQPGELKALLTFQESIFTQNLGFTMGLLLPSLVLLAYIFFGTKAALSNPGVAFWLFIGGVVITILAHYLRFFSLYFSLTFLAITVLLVSYRLVKYFSSKTTSHYVFGVGWVIWISIIVINLVKVQFNYLEVPLIAMLFSFSAALMLQKQEKIETNRHQEVKKYNREIETKENTILDQQKVIKEKDRALEIKQNRIKTNKAILEKAGRRLKEKEQVLKFQNRQITQSIEYARNIQEAILPTAKTLGQLLQEHFLLFRPKDIVSGDFYWCSQIELNKAPTQSMENFVYQTHKQYIFVAAIDCTGHGVPGAFMSMIGNTLLNEIVNEKDIYDPGEILETLHISIRSDLRQAHSGNMDGMDISLCRLEKMVDGKTEVLFAGAKRDLYCLKKQELLVVPGERKSIGGSQKEAYRSFTVHKVLLEKNDRIYLVTDGLEDMAIGTKTRKSFGTKRLKAFITKYKEASLEDQHKLLKGLVDKYNANTEQRDDILVLGIGIQ